MGIDLTKRFRGDYLSAKDYEEGDKITLTIKDVRVSEFKDQDTGETEEKIVIDVLEEEQGMVLNRSNGRLLKDLCGNDSDAWKGKRIKVLIATSGVGPFFKVLGEA